MEEISKRLRQALDMAGMKQVELSEKTKIPKGSISQYLSGFVDPKSDRIYLMAKALGVNPVWLMGYDVSMAPGKYSHVDTDAAVDLMMDPANQEIIRNLNLLNDEEKKEVSNYIEFLIKKRAH